MDVRDPVGVVELAACRRRLTEIMAAIRDLPKNTPLNVGGLLAEYRKISDLKRRAEVAERERVISAILGVPWTRAAEICRQSGGYVLRTFDAEFAPGHHNIQATMDESGNVYSAY